MRNPFPEGWYFVAKKQDIVRTRLVQRTWHGREIVAFSDGEGRVCVAESVCPHLGSQLGPEAGGRVRGGRLVCPFHGFQYDISGRCVATPSAPPPPAHLNVFQTHDILGMVFAWHGTGAPRWALPEAPESQDWSEIGFRSVRFAGHPQDTTENVVDLAHLAYVHGYDRVARTKPVTVSGAYLHCPFAFRRTRMLLGLWSVEFDVAAVGHVHGLGYSFVEIREHSIGMDLRLWVLPTPLDGKQVELVLAGQVRNIRRPKRWVAGLAFLPVRLRTAAMNQFVLTSERSDVMQDVGIWQRRQHRERPRLSRADGEIMLYRRYCEQFFDQAPRPARPLRQSVESKEP